MEAAIYGEKNKIKGINLGLAFTKKMEFKQLPLNLNCITYACECDVFVPSFALIPIFDVFTRQYV